MFGSASHLLCVFQEHEQPNDISTIYKATILLIISHNKVLRPDTCGSNILYARWSIPLSSDSSFITKPGAITRCN